MNNTVVGLDYNQSIAINCSTSYVVFSIMCIFQNTLIMCLHTKLILWMSLSPVPCLITSTCTIIMHVPLTCMERKIMVQLVEMYDNTLAG